MFDKIQNMPLRIIKINLEYPCILEKLDEWSFVVVLKLCSSLGRCFGVFIFYYKPC